LCKTSEQTHQVKGDSMVKTGRLQYHVCVRYHTLLLSTMSATFCVGERARRSSCLNYANCTRWPSPLMQLEYQAAHRTCVNYTHSSSQKARALIMNPGHAWKNELQQLNCFQKHHLPIINKSECIRVRARGSRKRKSIWVDWTFLHA
jgi:hypothetical protein